ncbi:hypothetical protein Zmor_016350 [Zophobas morio]|uniref:Uncharacterized protein n=1 Tax=Zophobas morio TaxID=2755281 RepID=A0AA38LZ33_9CUCU|nr:hypothetical protein Zmor_016350 [Zophobas morio]
MVAKDTTLRQRGKKWQYERIKSACSGWGAVLESLMKARGNFLGVVPEFSELEGSQPETPPLDSRQKPNSLEVLKNTRQHSST